MKRTLAAVVVAAIVVVSGTSAAAAPRPATDTLRAVVDRDLAAVIDHAEGGAMVSAIAVLRPRTDMAAVPLPRQRRDRAGAVERALRDTARSSQAGLIAWLGAGLADGTVSAVKPLWIVNAVSIRATPSTLSRVAARSDVAALLPDRALLAPPATASATATTNIGLVNAPALWDLGWRGQGTVVANLDTGVDVTHPELASRWRGGANSWYDPNGEHPTTPTDVSGHGTATMGVMVAGDATGSAIGMAPDAQWIAVKIFNDHGTASSTAIHLAMQWVLDPDGNPSTSDAPDVVNNSWTMSAGGCNLDFQPDLAALRAAGILPVFSAGNFGPTAGTVLSPANNPAAFSVGATDNFDVIDPSSSRGPSACGGLAPAIVAPGVGIHTTDLYGLYQDASGTSLAAPHVAGALALLLSAFPDTSADGQAAALITGAFDLGAAGADNDYGAGRLDVLAAYNWLASTSDFTLSAAPMSMTVNAGATATSMVTAGAAGGFSGSVSLTATGLPAGVGTATLVPTSVVVPGSAQLKVATLAGAPGGTYPVTVTGTAGSLVHTVTVTITVVPKNFTLTASPLTLTLARGKAGKITLTVTRTGGFTGAVTLKLTGLPTGATKSFVPNPIPNGTTTGTLTLKPTSTTPKGTYHLVITGTSNGKAHSVTVTLVVT